ncbi:MAG: DNA polymerase III subunit delta [Lachnospiraceae bacterium]|nr:DNA polymerase III subunit delta [Lachnospiraceae bacterium]MBQ2100307.1 DNA polymerase III subunit delta [Lachnospiraceae bacterium]MBQ3906321.1 DNA polymerase III subunit delta [Lachnospiraceae bacterium]
MPNFQDIIGQDQIRDHMLNAIKTGKISHAYVINGEQFSGKEFIAKIFAMALQCEERGKEGAEVPCQKCHSCKQALSGNQPDIIKVTHEKPNTISVDDIRMQISGDVGIKPYSSPYKIYIMNEAEKMTQQAQNALLKTLEEPPEYVIIMLLTTNVNAFLQTILSRCIVLNMKPVPDHLVRKYLMNELQITDYKAEVCVAFARGNLGKARQLAFSEGFENMKGEALSILKYVQDMELNEMVTAANQIKEYKLDRSDLIDIMMVWYRDVLLFKATSDMNHLVFREEGSALREVARRSSYEGIERVLEALDKAKKRLDANVNPDLVMELLFLTMKENG